LDATAVTSNSRAARIVYDARHFGPGATGIGRYSQHLLEELQGLDKKNEYFIFLQKKNFDLFSPQASNFKKVLVDAPIYSFKEQLFVLLKLLKIRPDLVHFPHFNFPILYPGKFVVTIHDLIVSDFGGAKASEQSRASFGGTGVTTRPKPLYWIKRLGYHLVINQAVKRARRILTPSNYVRGRIIGEFKVPREKVVVTWEAADLLPSKARSAEEAGVENVLGRLGLEKPFFLYVGNVYPHKNVSRLIEAIVILNTRRLANRVQYGRGGVGLVVVGAKDVFKKRLEREIAEKGALKYVTLTDYVTDADLIDLYRQAEAYVHPSLSEGFGLPPVEAMSLGTPVVEARASALPEVGGDAAIYFDPFDPEDIADKLGEILGNEALRQKLAKKGRARAEKFSWRRMAEQTLKAYESAIS